MDGDPRHSTSSRAEEARKDAGAAQRVLDAVQRHVASQARWHKCTIRPLPPYGDDSTSVGDALRRAAAGLGARRTGGGKALAGLVMAARWRWAGRRAVI